MGLPAATCGEVRDSLWRLTAEARAPLPACRVVREGEAATLPVRSADAWLTVEGEDGVVHAIPVETGEARLPQLGPGRYRLRAGDGEGRLIVAPAAAYEPPALAAGERLFGLSVQLYALRREGDQGVGDFTTLARLGDAATAAGAGLIALNPLHALFPADRGRASPYHPSDRRFLDPIHLDLAAVPGAHPDAAAAALSARREIDYPAVWAAKAAALERATAWIEANAYERAAIDAFVAAGGAALAGFCAFQAIAEAHPGLGWEQWPAALRDPESPAVAAFAAAHGARVRHHQILQWLGERQLAEAAGRAPGLGLCRDLAVGTAPDGAEAWAGAGRLAMAASVGAPPDAFAPQGQVWALPPPIPHRWSAEGYDSFAALAAANMRHAGALRIDHVLGLSRLFWVPAGAQGEDGAYVAYPMQDLLGVLALESVRARCLIVGEDLGTAPEGLREALQARRIYRYSVLPFERDGAAYRPPDAYPAEALACVATHDLPPLAGWWEGVDLEERAALGLLADATVAAARAERRTEKAALLAALAAAGLAGAWTPEATFTPELAAAIHAYVARSPSRLLAVQVEDLAAERVAVNLPGTDRERPNWRRRIGPPVERLTEGAFARAILVAVAAERPSS